MTATADVLDRHGNNAVVRCPDCGAPYIVSSFHRTPGLPKGHRRCPHCAGSVARMVKLKAASDGHSAAFAITIDPSPRPTA